MELRVGQHQQHEICRGISVKVIVRLSTIVDPIVCFAKSLGTHRGTQLRHHSNQDCGNDRGQLPHSNPQELFGKNIVDLDVEVCKSHANFHEIWYL